METTPLQPSAVITDRVPNCIARGLAAGAAIAGILLSPTAVHAAEGSIDGQTVETVDDNHGYDFGPSITEPSTSEAVYSPLTVDLTLSTKNKHMPYAPEFVESTEALEVSPSDVKSVIEGVQGGFGKFMGKVTITVRGNASAEDNRYLPDAGVSTPSEDNVELANARASHFVAALEEQLDNSDISRLNETDIAIEPGVEQVLNRKQVSELRNLAHEEGYSNTSEMIVAFNDGEATSDANKMLNDLLAPARGVRVTISGKAPVAPQPRIYKEAPVVENPNAEDKKAAPEAATQFTADGNLLGIGTLGVLALGVGVKRRRDYEVAPKVIPIELPKRPRSPHEFEPVGTKE